MLYAQVVSVSHDGDAREPCATKLVQVLRAAAAADAGIAHLLRHLHEPADALVGQLDELGALSGAGPGYAFVIIDALADAGVLIGLPRKIAIEAAAQTLYGAAKMVLETGKHPAELRDQVTSPGGTTIAGIHAMERAGIRAALMDGVEACLAKSDKMAGK